MAGVETRVEAVRIGGRELRLVRPAEPDLLLDDPGVLARNRADDYMPYWAYLWPGAFLLAEAIAAADWVEGAEVLEIGAGLGLAGLTALARGARVRFTDYDADSLAFVRSSVEANGFDPARASTARLDWREPPEETYPVILGADVLYERRLIPLVAGVLGRMLPPGGFALLADPYRTAAADLPDALAALGLRFEVSAVAAETRELGPVRGTLHRVWKP